MNPTQEHIGALIKRLSDRLRVSSDANLKQWELTMQQSRVLWFLDEQSGAASQKEIEEYLQVSHPTIVGIVARLEKNGFVYCYTLDDDKRVKIVKTTEKARAVREDIWEKRREMEIRMTRGFSEEEIEQLREMLQRLSRNVDESGKE